MRSIFTFAACAAPILCQGPAFVMDGHIHVMPQQLLQGTDIDQRYPDGVYNKSSCLGPTYERMDSHTAGGVHDVHDRVYRPHQLFTCDSVAPTGIPSFGGQAALASGIFFAGYVLFQMPGGYLAQVWSSKRFIFWSLILWGAAATLCGFSRSLGELLFFRFLLGIGEGGVWPATIVLLANWFAPHERARANGYWVLCQPIAIVISSPFSGWLLDNYNWRVMFIVQGLLPILFAAIWWWAVEDRPSQAKWLVGADAVPEKKANPSANSSAAGLAFLRDRNVWIFLVLNLLFACGAYGLLIWLPSAIRSMGARSNLLIGILTAMPYLFSCLGAVFNSRLSDRAGERRWHVAVPCVVAGVALGFGFMFSSTIPALGLLLLCMTGAGIYASLGPKWALMTEILPKRTAGLALGLVNGVGNIGGFAGPYAVGALKDSTTTFAAGFIFLSGCLVLSGVLVLFLRAPKQEIAAKNSLATVAS